MYIVSICSSNYEVALTATKLVFGELNDVQMSSLFSMLPTAYYTGASFRFKWYGHKLKVGYHVNGKVYLYSLD